MVRASRGGPEPGPSMDQLGGGKLVILPFVGTCGNAIMGGAGTVISSEAAEVTESHNRTFSGVRDACEG